MQGNADRRLHYQFIYSLLFATISCLMQYLESIKIYRVVLYTFREKSCIIHFSLSLSPFFLRESRLHARRYE